MNKILSGLSWLVTVRPWLTLAFLLLITVLLAAGATRRAPPPETAATLPKGNAVAEALVEIDDLFGDSGDVRVVTLLFRGDTLTPGGLAQMAALLDEIASDPAVNGLLAPVSPVMAPTSLVEAVLQVDGFESITQVEIDSARGSPEVEAALAAMTGADTDGTPVAISSIRHS